MLSKDDLQKIKKITKDFFSKTDLELKVEILSPIDKTLPIKITMEEPQILIGERGWVLAEVQRLLKTILKRKIAEDFYIDLDINDYKKKKIEYLKELAKSVADEVSLTKKERVLNPMPAYERRIIHLELAERQDVTTESIGREPERKVVIRPYP